MVSDDSPHATARTVCVVRVVPVGDFKTCTLSKNSFIDYYVICTTLIHYYVIL